MFLTPQQMDAFTAFTSGLPPGLPSYTCIPILPVLSAIDSPRLHPSILRDPHLFEVPACPGPLYSPSPSPRPHLNSH